jgi:hypothetical protein
MPRQFLLQRLLPSILLFLALPAAAIAFDWLLHSIGAGAVGRWFGPLGSALLVVSFVYSLRKRRWIEVGSPAALLRSHEVLSWTAALLLCVHGGIHFEAWIPWLGIAALLVVAGSGLAGRYLLADARRALAQRSSEDELLALALLAGAMQKWRSVHMPLTACFAALALVHVVATLILW